MVLVIDTEKYLSQMKKKYFKGFDEQTLKNNWCFSNESVCRNFLENHVWWWTLLKNTEDITINNLCAYFPDTDQSNFALRHAYLKTLSSSSYCCRKVYHSELMARYNGIPLYCPNIPSNSNLSL